MYTWCEADWYNGPSCGSSALCQINITYPCHYNLVSPSLSFHLSFIPHIINLSLHPETWSALSLSHLWMLFPPPPVLTTLFFTAALKRNWRGVLDKRAMSTESRRTQMSKLWILGHCLPLAPLLSLSLACTPCSGAGRSHVPPNQCSHASPKTITHSSTNQRKWGDKSTPGVCVCVLFFTLRDTHRVTTKALRYRLEVITCQSRFCHTGDEILMAHTLLWRTRVNVHS